MEACKDKLSCINPYVLLFTDGQPNIVPPRGHIYMLKKYIDTYGLNAPLYTYGFGNYLDSELLNDISIVGSGRYAYIPDCSFVGTIFVNSCSNILATMVKDV